MALRTTLPNYARVKTVDKKWKYLAQMGKKVTQDVEVVVCRKADETCLNDEDNPNGIGKEPFINHNTKKFDALIH